MKADEAFGAVGFQTHDAPPGGWGREVDFGGALLAMSSWRESEEVTSTSAGARRDVDPARPCRRLPCALDEIGRRPAGRPTLFSFSPA